MSRRCGTISAMLVGWASLWTLGCSSVPLRDVAQPRATRGDEELADRFIAHWNQNASQINSVVCQSVDINGQSEGQPYTLDARIAYQEPMNFRLTGTFLGKAEADLGSNSDEVWFWVARAQPPAVYFCRRPDLSRVNLPMPFHPDDLIQVLGAVPLDPSRYRFERGWDEYVTLISTETAPSGDPVVKRVVVDRASGRAAAFEVWDLYGQQPRKLAEARILDYHEDPSGAFVPKKVRLRLPEANTNLTLTMRARSIDINQIDQSWASNLFSRGNYINSQVVDLGEEYRRRQAALERTSASVEGPTILPTSATQPEDSIPSANQIPENIPSNPAVARLPDRPAMDRFGEPASSQADNLSVFEGVQPGGYRPGASRDPQSQSLFPVPGDR